MNKLQCYHFNDENNTKGVLFEFKDEPDYNSCYQIGYRQKRGLYLLYIFLSPEVKTTLKLSAFLRPSCVFKTELVNYDCLIALLNQTNNIVGYYKFNEKTIRADLLVAELVNLILVNWDDV